MEKKVTEVVAVLIWDRERFLICQRPAHKARGLLWEFVGGKVESGETKERHWFGSAGRNWLLRFRWVGCLWR